VTLHLRLQVQHPCASATLLAHALGIHLKRKSLSPVTGRAACFTCLRGARRRERKRERERRAPLSASASSLASTLSSARTPRSPCSASCSPDTRQPLKSFRPFRATWCYHVRAGMPIIFRHFRKRADAAFRRGSDAVQTQRIKFVIANVILLMLIMKRV